MALDQEYHPLWFVCYKLKSTSGHHQKNQLRLKQPQELPREITRECESRNVDPFQLFTQCNSEFYNDSNLGTEYYLEAKLNDRQGGRPFFTSPRNRTPLAIVRPNKDPKAST